MKETVLCDGSSPFPTVARGLQVRTATLLCLMRPFAEFPGSLECSKHLCRGSRVASRANEEEPLLKPSLERQGRQVLYGAIW